MPVRAARSANPLQVLRASTVFIVADESVFLVEFKIAATASYKRRPSV